MQHNIRNPRISIVIPCYNHGNYIDETIQSIDRIHDKNLYEIIIVNDGSTEELCNERLAELEKTGLYKIIWQENQGVCKARNNGFKHVRGEFVLPVDSDNRINPDFIYKAINLLDQQKDVSVVYCNSVLFGSEEGIRIAGEFNLQRLMLNNFIDNCSVFRSSLLKEIGYHDTFHTINGTEDWEFWLRAAFNGYKFHYLNEALFDYRVLPNSGSAKLNANKIKGNSNMDYFREKHSYYFGPQHIDEYFIKKIKSSPLAFLGKLIIKMYFPKLFSKLVTKGKLRKYI
ncbi:MAG TPA: glycosyltransferase family A protein [Flavipsychrobacter sp.]|nr:glycosyltransferase family A protein [Flavipsychrobacter sp.]